MYRLGYSKHETKTDREKWSYRFPRDHFFHLMNYKDLLNVLEKVNRHPLMIENEIKAIIKGKRLIPICSRRLELWKNNLPFATWTNRA